MDMSKNSVVATIKMLSNELELQYGAELNLRNHCFLRISYDITIQNKWDLIIKSPFTKYANEIQLQNALDLLLLYKNDKNRLLEDNVVSLDFRKKVATTKSKSNLSLF